MRRPAGRSHPLRRSGRLCALGWLAAASSFACAPAPAPPAKAPRRPVVLSTEYDDQRAGEEAKGEVAATLGLVRDPKVQELVDAVGRRLLAHVPARAFSYEFRVVDQWPPNAFTLPGGAVYVSRGLLVLSNSEDELANVLAHEIMHAAARHAAARQRVAGGTNPFAMVLTSPIYLAAYSRDQEREADRGGQSMAAAAGYDPAGMNDFLASLRNVERLLAGASRMPGFFDTHPPTSERTASTATRAQHLDWTRQPGVTRDREDYLRRLEGLVVGEDPAEGVFENGRFLHPDLDFMLRVPDGWQFVNTPAALGAVSPDGRARVTLELAGEGADPAVFAEAFVAQRAAEIDAEIEERRALSINGLPAVELRGSAPGPSGSVAGKLTWIAHARPRLPARESRAGPRRGARARPRRRLRAQLPPAHARGPRRDPRAAPAPRDGARGREPRRFLAPHRQRLGRAAHRDRERPVRIGAARRRPAAQDRGARALRAERGLGARVPLNAR